MTGNEAIDNNADVNEFSAESIDIGNLDKADGSSTDINMDALREMGIVLDDSSNQSEVNQPDELEGIEKLGEDASLDDIIGELSKNPKEHDQEIEDKLNDAVSKGDKDSKQPEKDLKEDLETIVYKGEEKKLSKSELKELAQKGYDYTQKTQEISKRNLDLDEKIKGLEEREKQFQVKFQEERQKFEKELNQKKQWDFVLNALQKQNPDLFEDVKSFSEELMVNYQNPLVQGLMEKVNALESRGIEKEDQEIANQYYRELDDVKANLIPKLDKLGIKVDLEKVKEAWINGAESVKAATYSIYGDQIRKLQESKIKLSQAKRKANIRKAPSATTASPRKEIAQSPRRSRSNYHDITKKIIGY